MAQYRSQAAPPAVATARLPALFVGHGSPMNAIEENEFHRAWRRLGETLPWPAAVLCVSAHWESDGARVSAGALPATIHDFGGFPPELFAVQYAAPGSPVLARRVAELTGAALDEARGLDHGAWSVLRAMYPNADVPVLQLSLDVRRSPAEHAALGRALGPLRDEGVLVLGSGNVVHNLGLIDWRRPGGFDWAQRSHELIKRALRDGGAPLVHHRELLPEADLAMPTLEHWLPLLYVDALRRPGELATLLTDRVVLGSISMLSVLIG
jgi:4,5-DOPA dioxygenase extradiol